MKTFIYSAGFNPNVQNRNKVFILNLILKDQVLTREVLLLICMVRTVGLIAKICFVLLGIFVFILIDYLLNSMNKLISTSTSNKNSLAMLSSLGLKVCQSMMDWQY